MEGRRYGSLTTEPMLMLRVELIRGVDGVRWWKMPKNGHELRNEGLAMTSLEKPPCQALPATRKLPTIFPLGSPPDSSGVGGFAIPKPTPFRDFDYRVAR